MDIQFLKNEKGKPVEGFLSEEPKAEILFLLKEPNAKDVKKDGFWFKKCVENNGKSQCRSETVYIKVLGCLASAILFQSANSVDRKDILKSCAYINLYPFSGESSQSRNFNQTLNALKELKESEVHKTFLESVQFGDVYDKFYRDEEIAPKEVAINRLKIIHELICNYNCKYIVTPCNIFRALYEVMGKPNQEWKCWLKYKNKNFRFFEYNGAKILEFWHPANPRISNELTENFKRLICTLKM